MPVMDWQCVVAVLKGALYFHEHSSDLGAAYLWKEKTAEFEFGNNAPEVCFDTSQTDFRYFAVTFGTYFVMVLTVMTQDELSTGQVFRLSSVTTGVIFQKTVLKGRGKLSPRYVPYALNRQSTYSQQFRSKFHSIITSIQAGASIGAISPWGSRRRPALLMLPKSANVFFYTAPGFMLPIHSVEFQVQFYVMSYAQLTKRDSSDSNI